MSTNTSAKIKFIKEADDSIYGGESMHLEMHLDLHLDKDTLYDNFLYFVKGCGYYVGDGILLQEVDPHDTDMHVESLENKIATLEDTIEQQEILIQNLKDELREVFTDGSNS